LLRRRQLGQHACDESADEVCQPREREPNLRLEGATGKHQVSACRRLFNRLQPERRLPNAGLADDRSRRGELIGRIEETNERVEFLVPANEAMRADSHDQFYSDSTTQPYSKAALGAAWVGLLRRRLAPMALPDGWQLTADNTQVEGGQAIVYKVEDACGDGPFALKRLKNRKRRGRFVREVRSMMQISERGGSVIPEITAHDLDDDRPYFVIPWCEETLEAAVATARYRDEPADAVGVLIELARALEHIHLSHAHRDLKPANVLICAQRLLVGDLGLALDLEDEAERMTTSHEAVGSRLYIAPENESGINEELDQRPADFYAFGGLRDGADGA
jgi:tRNA A-37 threonylcarbamoyl transferase component Bud32